MPKPRASGGAKLGWPKTVAGRVILIATLIYVAFWAIFAIWPSAREALAAVPVVGPALQIFFIAYLAIVVASICFMFLTELL